jgi:hypothetical protein
MVHAFPREVIRSLPDNGVHISTTNVDSGADLDDRSREGPIVQRFTLKGFPPPEKAAMLAAVPRAMQVSEQYCTKKYGAVWGKVIGKRVADSIDDLRYDYVPDLGLCGWTFPSSWYVEIGKTAFNPGFCCDLASTIAHEASHVRWFTEGGAQKLECEIFGCSC